MTCCFTIIICKYRKLPNDKITREINLPDFHYQETIRHSQSSEFSIQNQNQTVLRMTASITQVVVLNYTFIDTYIHSQALRCDMTKATRVTVVTRASRDHVTCSIWTIELGACKLVLEYASEMCECELCAWLFVGQLHILK